MSVTLDDLAELGLDQRWLRVASRIGVPAFLAAWEELDQENRGVPTGERDQIRVRVPLLARLRRYLRNRWIRQLASQEVRLKSIQKRVADPREAGELCEKLSVRQISRIIGGS